MTEVTSEDSLVHGTGEITQVLDPPGVKHCTVP